MTDQRLALQAVSEAQRILEEYLQPRPKNNERILDRLVEVLERPDLVVAVSRFQQQVVFEDEETS
jgi:5-methylcytosine-specific restriction endonuclease McrBC regulatory subunit McrC